MVRKPVQSRAAQSRGGEANRPGADAVDRAHLARFTLGNAELEREVLELFAGQAPIYLQGLREAATRKQWREAAHTIKGSAAAVGAWRLVRFAELAEKIDIETEASPPEGYREQAIAAVAAATDEVCRYVARLFPARSG